MNKVFELIKKHFALVKYVFFGGLTTVINIISYYLCNEQFGLSNVISTIIAWVLAVAFAFVTNKLYVFDSKAWNKKAIKEVVEFFTFRIVVGIIELGLMILLVDILKFNGTLMKLVTNIVAIVLNYIASKFIVFKKK